MAVLIKELAETLYKLNNLYYEVENKEDKEKLKSYFDTLSKMLEESIRTKFDEHDKLYLKTIETLKQTEKEIDRLKTDLKKITLLYKSLSDLLMQIDTLVFN
jgi:hypothetical protein